jgi:cysteinyl-tRNA synthetase
MYTCGPTVYDSAHVGNFRAFLTYDLLKRVLVYLGYAVLHVCNLTDVDDKIIQRANERRVESIDEITGPCTAQFFDDLRLLNVVPATRYPRATEHISDMTDMILRLRDNGLAYETGDGSWYFDTQKQPGYGTRLVQLNRDEMRAGAQAGNDGSDSDSEPEKRHPADFCLWKAFKEGFDRDDASWSSPPEIGRGRPGWHLECSAMVRRYLGDRTLDLHGGGIDLKFPHHENEIAQSEGCSGGGSSFCACWFHNGFVNVGEGEKMSKSLGNFVTLRQACPTPQSVRAYRYLVVASQYRNPLSFTDQALQGAESALARIDRVRSQIRQALELAGDEVEDAGETAGGGAPAGGAVIRALERFESAIRDDLAMPRAAAALFGLVKRAEEILRPAALASSGAAPGGVRADALAGADARELRSIQRAMERMDSVFGIFYDPEFGGGSGGGAASSAAGGGGGGDDNIPAQVLDLAARRAEAKAAKDWELADELRSRIAGLGYQIKDVKGGEPVITRAGAAGR